MTGFARVKRSVSAGEIMVSLKSVNHRGLDVHFHMPPEMDGFEGALRSAIKSKIGRGHVQMHAAFEPGGAAPNGSLNRPLLQAWLSAFDEAVREFGIVSSPDLNVAFRIPGMFRVDAPNGLKAEVEQELLGATLEALDVLNGFREREGAAIAGEMRERCAAIRAMVERMQEIRSRATATFQKRLKERLSELLRGAGIEVQRLVQEAALLADRSDISEELIRLKTHAGQLEDLLNATGEVGKKLDFLLQEMNRETNTILSKTGGLGDLGLTITDLALAVKSEIDKIREQSLNVE